MAETIEELKTRLSLYEQNGAAKLYYSLNRKMNEMADLLNKTNLGKINLDDKESKEFDRLFKLLEKSKVIGEAVQTVKGFAGITGNEKEDVDRRPFNDRLAEDRS